MRHHRIAAGIMALVGASGFLGVGGAAAFGASGTFAAPVYAGDFPDPAVVLVNGTYWAYATGSAGRNLQVMSSTDLHTWSPPTDPLPVLPAWASAGRTWAPGVVQVGASWLMYYTVHGAAQNQQCISLAVSPQPGGPFVDTSSGPLICQAAYGGSIDPNPYLDARSGNLYLLWKSDDNSLGAGHPTHLWGQQLASDGRSLVSGTTPSLLLTESAGWQAPTAEGPTVVRHGSQYYLFYSANNYNRASSGIGYATSGSLLGRYANWSLLGPWLGTRDAAQGPQGPWIFTDTSGHTRMAFAAWDGTVGYQNGGIRSLWIGSLGFGLLGNPSIT